MAPAAKDTLEWSISLTPKDLHETTQASIVSPFKSHVIEIWFIVLKDCFEAQIHTYYFEIVEIRQNIKKKIYERIILCKVRTCTISGIFKLVTEKKQQNVKNPGMRISIFLNRWIGTKEYFVQWWYDKTPAVNPAVLHGKRFGKTRVERAENL